MTNQLPSLEQLTQQFDAVPHSAVASNVPYSVADEDVSGRALRAAAKADFLANDCAWPELTFPQLEVPSLENSERGYLRILSAVAGHKASPEADLLYETTARKLGEVYRHMEIRRLLGSTALESSERSRGRAATMSAELFGEVDSERFWDLLAPDVRRARFARDGDDIGRARLATEFIDRLGLDEAHLQQIAERHVDPAAYELKADAVETIRGDLFALFPKLHDVETYARLGDDIAPAAAIPAFEAALEAFHLTEKGWKVRLLHGSQAAEANAARKEITVGKGRTPFTAVTVVTKPIHEAIHALQMQNADDQVRPHRRRPLPGNLAFSEGLPSVIEQIISGVPRTPGVAYYIQLGLSSAVDKPGSSAGRSFQDVNEIMWRRSALARQSLPEVSYAASHEKFAAAEATKTYKSVMRTNRGNAPDSRDISYFDGASRATQFLNQTATLPTQLRRARLLWALSGQFDPTNPAHAKLFSGDPAADHLKTNKY